MKSKWETSNQQRNLATALETIQDLLNTTELNLDDMEDSTRDSIRRAYEFLDEAHAHSSVVGT